MGKPTPKNRPGPEADRLKLDMDWEKAVEKALGKKRPPEGWPTPPGKKKRQTKKKPG
jgi:hypothetical protein